MTKLVTSIACVQLEEAGKLSFDDPAVVEKHLPELAAQGILQAVSDDGSVTTTPRTQPLTLRHLLTHTSGLAYNFASPLLAKWETATHHKMWFEPRAGVESITIPLLFEPGSKYVYGLGLDWAGVLVERVSGLSLEDYFHKHIFGPAGVSRNDMTFIPTDSVKARLATMYARTDGGFAPTDALHAVQEWQPSDVVLQSGGAGLIGSVRAWLAFMSHILRCQHKDGALSTKGFAKVFGNALPPREGHPQIYKDLGDMAHFEGITQAQYATGAAVAHSLGLLIFEADSALGRKKGSGAWSGAARTRFWIDPASGVAGFCGTQVLETEWAPFAKVVDEFETLVYEALV